MNILIDAMGYFLLMKCNGLVIFLYSADHTWALKFYRNIFLCLSLVTEDLTWLPVMGVGVFFFAH